MSIPDFQSFFVPLLKFAADGKLHTVREAREYIEKEMELTQDDLAETISSGQSRFANRVHWAKAYFIQAGVLSSPKRGTLIITERGKELLKENHTRISIKELKRYPEFIKFQSSSNNQEKSSAILSDSDIENSDETPDEILEKSYKQICNSLSSELLEKVKNNTPEFFENLVVDLMIKMGYGGSREEAGRSVGKVGDEGIDGVIKEDKLGLDMIYLQAKKWDGTVGRPEIQKFVGALQGKRARKGVFITTGTYAKSAKDYADNIETKVILIDGELLVKYMIEFNLGVTTSKTFEIKDIDSDYFSEE
jgi:restriction system protein